VKGKIGNRKLIILSMVCLLMMLAAVFMWRVYGMDLPTKVKAITDENAIMLTNGRTVKLWGIEASRSSENFLMMKEYLKSLLDGRNLWIEYDQSGKGVNWAWVWVGCESRPKFLISLLSGSKENPVGCKKGALVNEQIIKMGLSKVNWPSAGRVLKYRERLETLVK
jgi:hypothetical protein